MSKKAPKHKETQIILYEHKTKEQSLALHVYPPEVPFFLWDTAYAQDETKGILALDASLTATGWAYGPEENDTTFPLVFSDMDNSLDGQRRINWIVSNLISMLKHYKPAKVCYEGYAYGASTAAYSLGELGGIIRMLLREYVRSNPHVVLFEYTPGEIKKFVTGKGNGAKELLLMFVLKKFKIACENNNQADAVGLYYLMKSGTVPSEKKKKKRKKKE